MNCEDGMVVYNVRWSSEQVEHKGYVNDQKLEKECGVYLKSGQCVRCSGLMQLMKMLGAVQVTQHSHNTSLTYCEIVENDLGVASMLRHLAIHCAILYFDVFEMYKNQK